MQLRCHDIFYSVSLVLCCCCCDIAHSLTNADTMNTILYIYKKLANYVQHFLCLNTQFLKVTFKQQTVGM